ncbi:CBD9-like protein [Delitschia confertaspora ATCC 74209]|uniref:CBD9-like protein n=1 Tax=Delitschia confertaspora ATCC 74209 TaxID=1513339 RepID=A0A9P4JQB1_9PLEO|nr:CBD9-like protein [Delitschia confertaspora ATCC 74209]
MFFINFFSFVVAALALLSTRVFAGAPAASTFYIEKTQTQFSLNIANESFSNDISIYFTSPAYSWVAVGFGERMSGSLMLVMYLSKDSKNISISPRIATSHSEPTFAPSINLTTLPGTGIVDDMFVLKAVCHNCKSWSSGSLPENSNEAPMIYAFGPGSKLQSDSKSAPLKRHYKYGRFTMDMVAARGASGIPEPLAENRGVKVLGTMKRDHDRANLAHAVLGCIALFMLWPINTFMAGFVRRKGIQMGFSVFLMVFMAMSYGLGISVSRQYNHSKSFTTSHQILAFLLIPLLLLIFILPLPSLGNLLSASNILSRLHTPLSYLALILLLITGGLGLHLSSAAPPFIFAYVSLSLFTIFALLIIQTLIWKCGRNRRDSRSNSSSSRGIERFGSSRLGRRSSDSRSAIGTPHSDVNCQGGYRSGNNGRYSPNGGIYGGGTMPGPQYLLNMHPGVPVYPHGGAPAV